MLNETASYADDIPIQLATSAHAGTSFVPDERGAQARASYAAQLEADHAALLRLCDTPEKIATLAAEFERYRAGLRTHTLAHLSAKSRCVSTMIAGPSKFNVRRAERANAAEHGRLTRLVEFRERALTAIRKTLRPEDRPIMAGDGDALTRLRAQLDHEEQLQARRKEANKAIRKHRKAGPEAQIAALVALGFSPGASAEMLKPDFCGRIGFADYEITNAGANIRRIRARLASLEVAKAAPEVTIEGANARLEDCPPDNRVRLFFAGKPAEAVRTQLKAAGFRWTPTLGCWQAYRNHHSLATARSVAGIA